MPCIYTLAFHCSSRLFALLLALTVVPCVAQITVDQSLTFQEYVNSLLGEGVTAYNVDHTGADIQFGFFEGGASVGFPIDEGVILSSDDATSACPGADGVCSGAGVPPDLWRMVTPQFRLA